VPDHAYPFTCAPLDADIDTMPSQKSKELGQQSMHPQPSDYDTEAPAQAAPPLGHRSTDDLNLSVIRRHYPDVVSIMLVTPYVVLYTMAKEAQKWDKERVDIQGTLFTCQLTPSPNGTERFAIVILNRHGLTNFYLEITSGEEVELQDDYIMCAANDADIVAYGLWVHADPSAPSTADARTNTVAKIQGILQRVRAHAVSAEQVSDQASENGQSEVEPREESVPMGRQLSLRELFGQQPKQHSGSSVHSRGDMEPNNQLYPQNAASNQNMQNLHAMQHIQHVRAANLPPPMQNDVLGQLFMKAKQDYNGVG
jgi:hypothetical protein